MKNNKECLILDIRAYFDRTINKRTLCEYLSYDLNIVAMPYWELIMIIVLCCLGYHLVTKIF